jgi:signal transduction histidine kinase
VGGGHGVLNIRDRIGAIGGIAEWESSPGSGTRLHGSVPSRGEPPR